MSAIDRVLSHEVFGARPPVLVDVGASGGLDPRWRPLAPYSTCIAFDGDAREMSATRQAASRFRRLEVVPKVVVADDRTRATLYLTRSPFCSSTLRPTPERLRDLPYDDLFEPESTTEADAVSLPGLLRDLGVAGVDWFKTDSQGTDLRLFRSLGDDLVHRVLVAEFEPGVVDAYEGEDKLHDVMAFMASRPFWLAQFDTRGVQRIRRSTLSAELSAAEAKLYRKFGRIAPGWAELLYVHAFDEASSPDVRAHLLGWVFAVLLGHHGFALDLALAGRARFGAEPMFEELVGRSKDELRRGLAGTAAQWPGAAAAMVGRRVRALFGGR